MFFALALAWAPAFAHAQDEAEPAPSAPRLTPPRLLEAPSITLDEGAEPLPEDAAVELMLVVGADGTVAEARIVTPVREDVDARVLEATESMRFEPATRDGEPIPARIRFRFRVGTPPPPAPPESETPEEGSEEGAEDEASEEAEEEAEADPIDLEAFDTGVSELGVEAVADRVEAGAATRITLEAEELTTVPGSFGEPLRVIANMPGVVRSPFGLGFFLVRGANFENTGFLVDGFPVPILYHLGAGPAVISSRLVSRLNFYPGGYPAMYGRFSAGLVSVETAPPETESIRGELEIDIFRASLMVVVPFADGRGSVAAAFRRSYFELILPLVQPGLDLNYTDYQLRGDYRASDQVRFSLFVFGSDDRLDQRGTIGEGAASEGTQNAITYEFQRAIGKVELRLPSQIRFTLAGMLGRDGNTFETSQPGQDALRFEIENYFAGLRLDGRIPFTEDIRAQVGADLNVFMFNVRASAFVPPGLGEYSRPIFTPQASQVARTIPMTSAAFYWDQIFQIGPIELSTALRMDYMRYGDVSDVFPDPRAVARWQVVPELVLKAATGLFTQAPLPFQLARDGGNPGLQPQRAWQTSAGAEVTFPERVELTATGFYSQMFQISQQVSRIVAGENGPQRQFFADDGEGRAYGLEVMLRRRVEQGFYGWLSYTLSRSERLTSAGRWVPFTFDQTHVLNLAASYAIDGWRFGVAFLLATGRPEGTLVGTVYDADVDRFNPSFRNMGGRIGDFHRLDVRIDRDFDFGPVKGSIYLDIQNVYNAPNMEGTLFSYDYTESAPLPGLPILPTIGVRGILE